MYIKTSIGLPNNCSATGQLITEGYWYAANADAALAGQGVCEAYAIEHGLIDAPDVQAEGDAPKTRKRKGASVDAE